jgi:hypothetical protein
MKNPVVVLMLSVSLFLLANLPGHGEEGNE